MGSLTVGVVQGKRLVWTKSYGFADELNRTPATRDTVYRIGSITKQFTAVMLLQLVASGKVRLSDPVVEYYPEIEKLEGWPPARPITLRELATHRGGLAREPDGCLGRAAHDCQYQIGPVATWERTLEAALPHVKIESPPGSAFSYSNVGYAILGAALAKAADVPYTRYITENIFEPLGMTHTGFEPDADMRRNLAKGYIRLPTGYDSKSAASELVEGRGYKVPNGAIFTTVGDLARFVSFEMGDGPQDVLKRDVLRANHERSFAALIAGLGPCPGCELRRRVRKDDCEWPHRHGTRRRRSRLFGGRLVDPDRHIGIICLRNSSNGAYREAAIEALVSILGK